jgi:hypothetical protein
MRGCVRLRDHAELGDLCGANLADTTGYLLTCMMPKVIRYTSASLCRSQLLRLTVRALLDVAHAPAYSAAGKIG